MTESAGLRLVALLSFSLSLAACAEDGAPIDPDDPELPGPGWTLPGHDPMMTMDDRPPLGHVHHPPLGPDDLFLVAIDQPGARSLQAGGGRVRWAAIDGGVGRIVVAEATNGNTETHLIGPTMPYGAIESDDDHFYWADPYHGTVMVATQGALGAEKFADAGGIPIGVAATETHVFWVTVDGRVLGAAKATRESQVIYQGPNGAAAIVTDGEDLFWSTEQAEALLRAPLSGGVPQAVHAGDAFTSDLVLDDTRLYWLSADKDAVLAVPKAGGDVRPLAESQLGLSGLAVDRFFVYFTTSDDGAVKRVNKDGSGLVTLVQGLSLPTDIAVDDEWIYVNHSGHESILKFAK